MNRVTPETLQTKGPLEHGETHDGSHGACGLGAVHCVVAVVVDGVVADLGGSGVDSWIRVVAVPGRIGAQRFIGVGAIEVGRRDRNATVGPEAVIVRVEIAGVAAVAVLVDAIGDHLGVAREPIRVCVIAVPVGSAPVASPKSVQSKSTDMTVALPSGRKPSSSASRWQVSPPSQFWSMPSSTTSLPPVEPKKSPLRSRGSPAGCHGRLEGVGAVEVAVGIVLDARGADVLVVTVVEALFVVAGIAVVDLADVRVSHRLRRPPLMVVTTREAIDALLPLWP